MKHSTDRLHRCHSSSPRPRSPPPRCDPRRPRPRPRPHRRPRHPRCRLPHPHLLHHRRPHSPRLSLHPRPNSPYSDVNLLETSQTVVMYPPSPSPSSSSTSPPLSPLPFALKSILSSYIEKSGGILFGLVDVNEAHLLILVLILILLFILLVVARHLSTLSAWE